MRPKNVKVSSSRLSIDPYYLYICIEGDTPKATNVLLGAHWRTKHANAVRWKELVGRASLQFRPPKLLERFEVLVLRSAPRMLDYDGLVASCKPLLDGLKGLVIADDSWDHTGPWKVQQKQKIKKEGPVSIELWIKDKTNVA